MYVYENAQNGFFINGADASLRLDSSAFLSIDGDFYNMNCDPALQVRFNGRLYLTGSFINNDSLKFSASGTNASSAKSKLFFRSSLFTPTTGIGAIIGGSIAPSFWAVEIDKGGGNQLTLQNNARCMDTLTFKSGFLYLNGYKWILSDPVGVPSVINHPWIKNEKHSSQFAAIIPTDSGQVIYKTIYTNSSSINPANIGIEINGPLNIGSPLNIYRGVHVQVYAGKSSILKYYDVYSSGHSLHTNTHKIRYTYTEMNFHQPNYLSPNDLGDFASPNSDIN